MKRLFLMMVPTLVTLILLAGCGSSSKTAGSGSAKSSSSTTSSGGGGGGYGGAYGGSSSSSGAYGSGSSSGAPSGSSTATQISTKHSKFGMILAAGAKHMTVYLFERDTGSASSCSGACASAWPPVTTSAKPAAQGQAMAADLGMITRSDGTKQVTYKGHPLYYFIRDKDSGDAYGEGVKAFGAGWYVLAPSGQKIDNS